MEEQEPSTRRGKRSGLPCESEAEDRQVGEDGGRVRQFLEKLWTPHRELFPEEFGAGVQLPDSYRSVKQELRVRRLRLKAPGAVFLVRPASVLPYLNAQTAEIEKALDVRQWGVPFEALAYGFGREAMFYDRAWVSLGRKAIVGMTVKAAEPWPKDLLADEKPTGHCGHRAYGATTGGGGGVLGAAVAPEAATARLHAADGELLAAA